MADTPPHRLPLTERQIRALLSGAGAGLTAKQTETLQDALRDGTSVTAEQIDLLAVPTV
jgi:hypothetical protein